MLDNFTQRQTCTSNSTHHIIHLRAISYIDRHNLNVLPFLRRKTMRLHKRKKDRWDLLTNETFKLLCSYNRIK